MEHLITRRWPREARLAAGVELSGGVRQACWIDYLKVITFSGYMTAPYLRIIDPGAVWSWALEDRSEAEFRETLALLSRLCMPVGSPGARQLSCDLQVLETWLRALKASQEQFRTRSADLDAERQRLRDEIQEMRRREAWDPGSMRLRLQLEDSLHRLAQDLSRLQESSHRSETEAKKYLLESYTRIKNQFTDLDLPAVNALLAFLECDPPRRVLIIHDPEPFAFSLPERFP